MKETVSGRSFSEHIIVTVAVYAAVFKILTLKTRKIHDFSTPPFFDARARGNPLEFLDETYPA